MYGPDYSIGACPGCTSLGDEFSGALVHLNKRDVTFLCFSRAPIDRLAAYKERMGWEFPYVSTYDTDFPWDFGLAMTEEQAQEIPEVKEMIDDPPDWLQEWSRAGRAPSSRTACARARATSRSRRENGTVYHTYTVMAPDPFVAPSTSLPARSDAEGAARGAARLAQGRVPGLNQPRSYRARLRARSLARRSIEPAPSST